MASAAPAPTKIRLDRPAKSLVVRWSDGFEYRYPLALLRDRCPSAGERVAREEAEANPNPLAILPKAPSSEVQELRPVGSYAIAFTWADGHGAGIYTWEFLRELGDDPRVSKSPAT